MQGFLESFGLLKKRFGEDDELVKLTDREIDLVGEWISDAAPLQQVGPRVLGAGAYSVEKHGTGSILDDIADYDSLIEKLDAAIGASNRWTSGESRSFTESAKECLKNSATHLA